MSAKTILIIDDENDVREMLASLFEDQYNVIQAGTGYEGVKQAIRKSPDLILLDLKMPNFDGFEVCRFLRADAELIQVPIVVLSGSLDNANRARLFQLGADDCIEKPFDSQELMARINRKLVTTDAVHAQAAPISSAIRCGDLVVDNAKQELWIKDSLVEVGQLECRLLYYLAANLDKLVNREQIIEKIWQGQKVSSRLINPHVLSLRRKLKGSNCYISSVYKCGYALKLLE